MRRDWPASGAELATRVAWSWSPAGEIVEIRLCRERPSPYDRSHVPYPAHVRSTRCLLQLVKLSIGSLPTAVKSSAPRAQRRADRGTALGLERLVLQGRYLAADRPAIHRCQSEVRT